MINLINEINIRLINVIIISRSQFINSLGTIILFFDFFFFGGGGEVGDVDDLCSRVLVVLLGVDFLVLGEYNGDNDDDGRRILGVPCCCLCSCVCRRCRCRYCLLW